MSGVPTGGGDATYLFMDCGNGRRLERFGGVTVDRPAPAAVLPPLLPPDQWREAHLSYDQGTGWQGTPPLPWLVRFGSAILSLRPAPNGQLGVFPEHAAISDQLDSLESAVDREHRPSQALNLFAHTGLATLRLAAWADTRVVHVDGSTAATRQARENAVLSGLNDRPVRWLVEDVMTFARREVRRGSSYDVIVADPPSYGRGGRNGEWKLERDIGELVQCLVQLLRGGGPGLCLTCHSEGWDGRRLAAVVRAADGVLAVRQRDLTLSSTVGGQTLPSGCAVWARKA